MKITKAKLKQIIREELENLEEYSPYKTGARPDKPHKKPGETKDDGKYADPKRARPKKRYEEQEELGNVAEAEQMGFDFRPPEERELQDALEAYEDWVEEQIARDIHNYDEPTEFNIIKWMSSRQAGSGRKHVHLLGQIANEYGFNKPDVMRGLKMYGSKVLQRKGAEALKGYRRKRINEELTRQDKTDVKKMVKDELEKLLKKKEMKDQISELTKKILKKLYKDLSLEHPYIIDRIKV